MFFNIDDEIERQIVSSTFPTKPYINYNSLVIDNYGNNGTSIKLSLLLQDDLSNFKVFNNLNAKKMMFLRVFEINSQEMENDLKQIKNIVDLNTLLQRNKTFYKDLNAAVSFIGDNKNAYEHYVQNNKLFLNYKYDFILPYKNPQYLSFGAVFFYDTDLYAEENKISKKLINYNTIFGEIKVENFINNFLPASPSLKDLRITKDLFNIDRLYEQATISVTGIKQQSVDIKKIPTNQYFSNIFITKKTSDKVGLFFNLDYKKILTDNSPVKELFTKSKRSEFLLNKSFIADIKIKRKDINNNTISYETLINTSDNIETLLLNSAQNSKASIGETSIYTDSNLMLRSIEVEDKKVLSFKKGAYQYGLEIKFVDGIVNYLQYTSKLLSLDNTTLVKYLSETDKVISTPSRTNDLNPHSLNTSRVMAGMYDPIAGRFSPYFLYDYFPKNYQSDILKIVSRLMEVLELFGMIKIDYQKMRSIFVSMLNPYFATAQTISYFTNLHSRIINQINKILKETYNNNFAIEHWFENDFVQVDEKPQYGYKFFNINAESVFDSIDSDTLNIRTSNEVVKYSKNSAITPEQENKKYSYLSPTEIILENNTLVLDNLVEEKDYYFLDAYKKAELEIKRYLLLNKQDKEVYLSNMVNNISVESQRQILKNNRIFNNNSTIIKIINEDESGKYNLINDIDPTMLHLGLGKYTNGTGVTGSVTEYSLQLELLQSNNSRFFDDAKYIKDLDYNSKYLFLYSSIHAIEYLSYDNNLKIEKWKLFDKAAYDNMVNTKKLLCRLKQIDYNLFEQISLPIYNKYFFLTYKQETSVTFRKREDQKEENFARAAFIPKPPPEQPAAKPVRTLPASLGRPIKNAMLFKPLPEPKSTIQTTENKQPPPELPVDGRYPDDIEGDRFNVEINGQELAANTRYSLYNNQNIVFKDSSRTIILKSKIKAGDDSRFMLIAEHMPVSSQTFNTINRICIIDRLYNDKILWQLADGGEPPANNVWEIYQAGGFDMGNHSGPKFITIRNGQMQIFVKGRDTLEYKPLITAGTQNNDDSIANTAELVLQDDGNLALRVSDIQVWATNTYGGRITKGPKNYGGGNGDDITVIKGIN